jgi:hypothetical protein
VNPYLDTLYSAFEMIGSGITTVQHLHGWAPGKLPDVEKRAGEIIRAYEDIGMRVSYCLNESPCSSSAARSNLIAFGPMPWSLSSSASLACVSSSKSV